MIDISEVFLFSIVPENVKDLFFKERNLVFKSLGGDDFSHSDMLKYNNRESRYINRINDGHQCFGFVTPDGGIVSYLWLSGSLYGTSLVPFEAGTFCMIPDGSAYIWDCRTSPSYRRQGLYQEGLVRLVQRCGIEGNQNVFIVCRKNNIISKNGIISVGFHCFGEAILIKLMRKLVVHISKYSIKKIGFGSLHVFNDY
jgi:hypothetical protein